MWRFHISILSQCPSGVGSHVDSFYLYRYCLLSVFAQVLLAYRSLLIALAPISLDCKEPFIICATFLRLGLFQSAELRMNLTLVSTLSRSSSGRHTSFELSTRKLPHRYSFGFCICSWLRARALLDVSVLNVAAVPLSLSIKPSCFPSHLRLHCRICL